MERYVAVDDSGVILNPAVAEGQIHGGIMQGLGAVFGEAMQYDEAGQVLTGSFMDMRCPVRPTRLVCDGGSTDGIAE